MFVLLSLQTVKAGAEGQELDVTQAWFTTRDDKAALQSKGSYTHTEGHLQLMSYIM